MFIYSLSKNNNTSQFRFFLYLVLMKSKFFKLTPRIVQHYNLFVISTFCLKHYIIRKSKHVPFLKPGNKSAFVSYIIYLEQNVKIELLQTTRLYLFVQQYQSIKYAMEVSRNDVVLSLKRLRRSFAMLSFLALTIV